MPVVDQPTPWQMKNSSGWRFLSPFYAKTIKNSVENVACPPETYPYVFWLPVDRRRPLNAPFEVRLDDTGADFVDEIGADKITQHFRQAVQKNSVRHVECAKLGRRQRSGITAQVWNAIELTLVLPVLLQQILFLAEIAVSARPSTLMMLGCGEEASVGRWPPWPVAARRVVELDLGAAPCAPVLRVAARLTAAAFALCTSVRPLEAHHHRHANVVMQDPIIVGHKKLSPGPQRHHLVHAQLCSVVGVDIFFSRARNLSDRDAILVAELGWQAKVDHLVVAHRVVDGRLATRPIELAAEDEQQVVVAQKAGALGALEVEKCAPFGTVVDVGDRSAVGLGPEAPPFGQLDEFRRS